MKLIMLAAALAALSSCSKQAPQAQPVLGQNLVTAGNPSEDRTITDGTNRFRVMARAQLDSLKAKRLLLPPDSVEAASVLQKYSERITGRVKSHLNQSQPASLVVGIPLELLHEQWVWDGVIIKTSDQNNTDMGDLKLTDMIPVHVRPYVVKQKDGSYEVQLMGCEESCTETSKQEDLQDMPILAVDTKNDMVIVDLSAMGEDLDLMGVADPLGQQTLLKTASTDTVSADYSLSTLVFDVESHMVPWDAKALPDGTYDSSVPRTVFTTRWFLRLSSAFNPAFEPREPTAGVGFFETERSADTKITRWSMTAPDGDAPVHYYIKNVPAEFQQAFKSAFDEWNAKLKPILGRDMFSYEFVPANDPKNALLVAGDPRFNIVEWDLANKASYGGLGPSIANQFTGENITANVYIQGPTIVQIYSDWFKVNAQAQALRDAGQNKAADVLLIQSRHEIFDQLDDLASRPRLKVSMNGLSFRVHSQRPELADPIAERNDFDPLPKGLTYDQYMYGYFHDMLTHELGHNLGLRHNFKGNLGSTGDGQGQVSRSVMEYLSRDTRYLDGVDDYDLMALSYGYLGKKPEHTDWFCTDEDGVEIDGVGNSAECTENDATADPFGWYESRLAQAIDDLVNRGDAEGPTWTVDNMDRELSITVSGMGYYASSAAKTASTWTNFFNKPDRPKNDPAAIKAYVVGKIKSQICDPSLFVEELSKATPQAYAQTVDNVTALRAAVTKLIVAQKAITADELKCE